jgi:hypothetical protein
VGFSAAEAGARLSGFVEYLRCTTSSRVVPEVEGLVFLRQLSEFANWPTEVQHFAQHSIDFSNGSL